MLGDKVCVFSSSLALGKKLNWEEETRAFALESNGGEMKMVTLKKTSTNKKR